VTGQLTKYLLNKPSTLSSSFLCMCIRHCTYARHRFLPHINFQEKFRSRISPGPCTKSHTSVLFDYIVAAFYNIIQEGASSAQIDLSSPRRQHHPSLGEPLHCGPQQVYTARAIKINKPQKFVSINNINSIMKGARGKKVKRTRIYCPRT
jgi:hypothetical protein